MPAFYKEWFYRAKLSLMATVITKPQPRPIVFVGENSSLKLCDTISRFGLKKILVVTDKPLVELGMLEGTQAALRERGVECQLYDGYSRTQPSRSSMTVSPCCDNINVMAYWLSVAAHQSMRPK